MEWKSLSTFKVEHLRIIPVKFGEITPSDLVMLFEEIADRRRMTDGQYDHISSP